jgi:hypothetical protein
VFGFLAYFDRWSEFKENFPSSVLFSFAVIAATDRKLYNYNK